jgi:hypothetical protein
MDILTVPCVQNTRFFVSGKECIDGGFVIFFPQYAVEKKKGNYCL